MDVKTIATLAVTFLGAVGAMFGHSFSPDEQSQLSTGLTDIATGITLIGPPLGMLFHALHVRKLTNPSNPQSQKG